MMLDTQDTCISRNGIIHPRYTINPRKRWHGKEKQKLLFPEKRNVQPIVSIQ